jgi:hypothetical protein
MLEYPVNQGELAQKYSEKRSEVAGQIDRLRTLFPNPKGDNLYVRGSFVRGDSPYGDIDVSASNTGGGYKEKDLPTTFEGTQIAFGFIPLEHLYEYFDGCLRGTSSLRDAVVLNVGEETPLRIFEEQKTKLDTERTHDYLYYLTMEEAITRRRYESAEGGEYEGAKRKAGSKRTISRLVWSYKEIFPELHVIPDTNNTIRELAESGIVSPELPDYIDIIQRLLKNGDTASDQWDQSRLRIAQWFDGELVPLVQNLTQNVLPRELVQGLEVSVDPQASSSELSWIYEYSSGTLKSYRKWMAMFALSSHAHTEQEVLVEILKLSRGNYTYRNIIRNLVRNEAFPVSALQPSDIETDIYAQRDLEKRTK